MLERELEGTRIMLHAFSKGYKIRDDSGRGGTVNMSGPADSSNIGARREEKHV
jgi:hypothetical protein